MERRQEYNYYLSLSLSHNDVVVLPFLLFLTRAIVHFHQETAAAPRLFMLRRIVVAATLMDLLDRTILPLI